MVSVFPGPRIVSVPLIRQSRFCVRNCAKVMVITSEAVTVTVTVAGTLTAAWLSCTVYWNVTVPVTVGVKVMLPSGLTTAVPVAGGTTIVTEAGFKLSPASGSVSLASTLIVTGVDPPAVAASGFATGAWFANATLNETRATFESTLLASVLT